MKLTFKEINCFIPSWNGNKKLPESEKVKIYWRYPAAEEVREIRSRTNPKIGFHDGKMTADNVEIEIIVDDILAVKKLVVRVENLIVDEKEIIDGNDLVKTPGLNGIVQEVSNEILAEMDKVKGNSKNSSPQDI